MAFLRGKSCGVGDVCVRLTYNLFACKLLRAQRWKTCALTLNCLLAARRCLHMSRHVLKLTNFFEHLHSTHWVCANTHSTSNWLKSKAGKRPRSQHTRFKKPSFLPE